VSIRTKVMFVLLAYLTFCSVTFGGLFNIIASRHPAQHMNVLLVVIVSYGISQALAVWLLRIVSR
jgi:hypothetical protein